MRLTLAFTTLCLCLCIGSEPSHNPVSNHDPGVVLGGGGNVGGNTSDQVSCNQAPRGQREEVESGGKSLNGGEHMRERRRGDKLVAVGKSSRYWPRAVEVGAGASELAKRVSEVERKISRLGKVVSDLTLGAFALGTEFSGIESETYRFCAKVFRFGMESGIGKENSAFFKNLLVLGLGSLDLGMDSSGGDRKAVKLVVNSGFSTEQLNHRMEAFKFASKLSNLGIEKSDFDSKEFHFGTESNFGPESNFQKQAFESGTEPSDYRARSFDFGTESLDLGAEVFELGADALDFGAWALRLGAGALVHAALSVMSESEAFGSLRTACRAALLNHNARGSRYAQQMSHSGSGESTSEKMPPAVLTGRSSKRKSPDSSITNRLWTLVERQVTDVPWERTNESDQTRVDRLLLSKWIPLPLSKSVIAESSIEATSGKDHRLSKEGLEHASSQEAASTGGYVAIGEGEDGEVETEEKVGASTAIVAGAKRRVRRGFTYPGTLWCGAGNSADNFDHLGEFEETDRCCRDHDHCEHVIDAFRYKYGHRNLRWHTISHCACDHGFKQCLRRSNDTASLVMGQAYFNVISVPCFTLEEHEECAERSWLGWCQRHETVYRAVVRDQEPYHYGAVDLIDLPVTSPTLAAWGNKGTEAPGAQERRETAEEGAVGGAQTLGISSPGAEGMAGVAVAEKPTVMATTEQQSRDKKQGQPRTAAGKGGRGHGKNRGKKRRGRKRKGNPNSAPSGKAALPTMQQPSILDLRESRPTDTSTNAPRAVTGSAPGSRPIGNPQTYLARRRQHFADLLRHLGTHPRAAGTLPAVTPPKRAIRGNGKMSPSYPLPPSTLNSLPATTSNPNNQTSVLISQLHLPAGRQQVAKCQYGLSFMARLLSRGKPRRPPARPHNKMAAASLGFGLQTVVSITTAAMTTTMVPGQQTPFFTTAAAVAVADGQSFYHAGKNALKATAFAGTGLRATIAPTSSALQPLGRLKVQPLVNGDNVAAGGTVILKAKRNKGRKRKKSAALLATHSLDNSPAEKPSRFSRLWLT
uniref:phospholipase A2 n=1 Tax=Petromyzon marinus TaxID=7757 RepID=A0AAJ7UFK8_PETMA|nr:uncharacterized protein LOC116957476 [Petromyzon marinus]